MNKLSRKEGSQVNRKKDCPSNHSCLLPSVQDDGLAFPCNMDTRPGTDLSCWKEKSYWTGNLAVRDADFRVFNVTMGCARTNLIHAWTWQAQILGHIVVELRVLLPACVFPWYGRKWWWILACNSMILGSRLEAGVCEIALSDMLPVSCAGTDGAGESQVTAQRKIV